MTLKFIQINIYKGKFLGELIDFLKGENPDIISAQEVTAGSLNYCQDKTANLFEGLKNDLGLNGVFHSDIKIVEDENARFGNALFSKYPILDAKIIVLKDFRPVSDFEFVNNTKNVWAELPRHMLDTTLDLNGKKIHAISVHGRRIAPPEDDEENLRQAQLMADYLKSLGDEPFILGGDFNMPAGSQTIKKIEGVATNLLEGENVKQTLNPKVHELGENGFDVDFIFTSKHFKKISVEVPQVTISDHLPIVAELEFNK
ncbi:MAG TPA: endonuclease/exonuclease/phosphatase family protein [Candidatus Saccharimonadales bacterium]|nr:endonuclease/exonuclease/phosphatase family protein [Candidatus Saccharimonadales bacterium]